MANDIKMNFNSIENDFDIKILDGDLEIENGLSTAVLISLFTDRKADLDDAIDDVNDKRGWWGDLTVNNDKIGSKLWQLYRSANVPDLIPKIKNFVLESLQWLIDDGIAESIDCEVERNENEKIYFSVTIKKKNGNSQTFLYDDLWMEEVG